jgi:Uma2 family endonuclease
MAPVKAKSRATIDDLRRVPKDGRAYELVDGVIVVTPAGMRHSAVSANITILLGNFVLTRQLGQVYTEGVGIQFPSGNVRSPDVTFVSAAKLPGGRSPVDYGRVVPDLVVEVLSPADSVDAMAAKLAEYLGAGVPVVWVADPERRTVRVHRATGEATEYGGDDLLTADPVLPGLVCRVSEFFPR